MKGKATIPGHDTKEEEHHDESRRGTDTENGFADMLPKVALRIGRKSVFGVGNNFHLRPLLTHYQTEGKPTKRGRAFSIVSIPNPTQIEEEDDGENLEAPTIMNEGVQPMDFYSRFLFPICYIIALILYFFCILE